MSKPEPETKTDAKTATPKPEPRTDARDAKAEAGRPNPFAPWFQHFGQNVAQSMGAFGAMPFGIEAFAPWLRDHADRLEAISDEVAAFEKAMMARVKANAGDVAALVQDSLDYFAQVGAEWRKIAIDTARRAADLSAKA